MADRLTPRDIPTALNILGLGLPQVGENLRTERSNQLLDLEQEARKRGQAANAQLAQSLVGTPGPFASGIDPKPALDPAASQATEQRFLNNFLDAGGSAADAVELANIQQGNVQAGPPSPKDFTVESIARWQESGGDFRQLDRWTDPLAMRRANQADDRLALAQLTAGRPSPAQQEKIIAEQISLDTLDNIVDRADRNYFGHGFDVVASGRKEIARRFGDDGEQQFVDFWREYENWILQRRKELFGSQFTPTEERVFDRLVAKPSDSFNTGMRNLQQQRQMVSRARLKRRSILEEFGFNVGGAAQPESGGVIDKTTR
jgi:hypothetical protein